MAPTGVDPDPANSSSHVLPGLSGVPEERNELPTVGVAVRPLSASLSDVRLQSGSPPRVPIPVFTGTDAHVRNRTSSGSPDGAFGRNRMSSGSPPPFHGALWNAHLSGRGREERPRFERDSLRNRSVEGRPGSRKHRRWTRSVEIMGSLRKAMAKCGEDPNITDAEALELENEVEWRPSAFYKLLELEGPNALEVLEAAESTPSRPRHPREKGAAQLAEEHERRVRRTFSDTWQFLQGNDSARELLAKMEKEVPRAFGTKSEGDDVAALLWMLHWDGDALETRFGAPPANEMAIGGLNPTFRKVAHQFARICGLHSESRIVDGPQGAQENKVIALRPPRNGGDCAWVAPLSVAKVLASV